jgi:hypothetical protein
LHSVSIPESLETSAVGGSATATEAVAVTDDAAATEAGKLVSGEGLARGAQTTTAGAHSAMTAMNGLERTLAPLRRSV